MFLAFNWWTCVDQLVSNRLLDPQSTVLKKKKTCLVANSWSDMKYWTQNNTRYSSFGVGQDTWAGRPVTKRTTEPWEIKKSSLSNCCGDVRRRGCKYNFLTHYNLVLIHFSCWLHGTFLIKGANGVNRYRTWQIFPTIWSFQRSSY